MIRGFVYVSHDPDVVDTFVDDTVMEGIERTETSRLFDLGLEIVGDGYRCRDCSVVFARYQMFGVNDRLLDGICGGCLEN